MARGDQLAKQWRIIQTLISAHGGRSAAELAKDLGCNPRTLYRDLEALQVAGFPMYTERVEGKNLWSLLDVVKHQIPIPFTLTELMALYFYRDMVKVFRGTVFYDALESLFAKVKTTLPTQSLSFLGALEHTLKMAIKPYKEYSRFREIINQANDAALRKKSVEMIYFTMSRKKRSHRVVDPYRVLFYNGTFYLIGLCHTRDEVRTFALDRISMLRVTNRDFSLPGDFNLEDFLLPSFGIMRGKPQTVRVRFDQEVAGYIREKVWHESQQLYPEEDGSLVLEMTVPVNEEVKSWVMSWGAKAEVLEPGALREDIREEARAMLATPATGREMSH